MIDFTKEQYKWLELHAPGSDWKTTQKDFNRVFNLDINLNTLKSRCQRKGIFTKGSNGFKWEAYPEGYVKTRIGGRDRKPYEYIKDKGVFIPMARYLYESKYGALPNNYVVIQLDGDTLNYDFNNLIAVSRKTQSKYMVWCRWHKGIKDDLELKRSALMCMELETLKESITERRNYA